MVIVSKIKSLHRLTILTSNKKNISLHVALLKKLYLHPYLSLRQARKKRNIKQITEALDP